MSCKLVVGPIFSETAITAKVYHDNIQQFVELLHKDEHDTVFQPGNEWPHVAKDMMYFLAEFFLKNEFTSVRHMAQIWPVGLFSDHHKIMIYKDAPLSRVQEKNSGCN